MLFEDFFHGVQPVMFCPLEGQPSIALVMLDLDAVVVEAAFGTGLLFQVGEWAEGAAVSESDPVSLQMLLMNKSYGKTASCNSDAVVLEDRKGQEEAGVALNSSSVWVPVFGCVRSQVGQAAS